MRLAIAVPTRDHVPAQFTSDLAELYAHTRAALQGHEVMLFITTCTLVHMGREKLLDDVVSVWAATHILWLDSDMTFPPDTALRLLAHNVDAVGCNCVARSFPTTYTAKRAGVRVQTLARSCGLEEVDSVGLAVFLMRASIVRGLSRPRFWYTYPHETEDGWFCRLLREDGRRILVDHELSWEVGHIGSFTYRLEHVGQRTAPCES